MSYIGNQILSSIDCRCWKTDQEGNPISKWDGVTTAGGLPSKYSNKAVSVYGPGTYNCIELTVDQVSDLLFLTTSASVDARFGPVSANFDGTANGTVCETYGYQTKCAETIINNIDSTSYATSASAFGSLSMTSGLYQVRSRCIYYPANIASTPEENFDQVCDREVFIGPGGAIASYPRRVSVLNYNIRKVYTDDGQYFDRFDPEQKRYNIERYLPEGEERHLLDENFDPKRLACGDAWLSDWHWGGIWFFHYQPGPAYEFGVNQDGWPAAGYFGSNYNISDSQNSAAVSGTLTSALIAGNFPNGGGYASAAIGGVEGASAPYFMIWVPPPPIIDYELRIMRIKNDDGTYSYWWDPRLQFFGGAQISGGAYAMGRKPGEDTGGSKDCFDKNGNKAGTAHVVNRLCEYIGDASVYFNESFYFGAAISTYNFNGPVGPSRLSIPVVINMNGQYFASGYHFASLDSSPSGISGARSLHQNGENYGVSFDANWDLSGLIPKTIIVNFTRLSKGSDTPSDLNPDQA